MVGFQFKLRHAWSSLGGHDPLASLKSKQRAMQKAEGCQINRGGHPGLRLCVPWTCPFDEGREPRTPSGPSNKLLIFTLFKEQWLQTSAERGLFLSLAVLQAKTPRQLLSFAFSSQFQFQASLGFEAAIYAAGGLARGAELSAGGKSERVRFRILWAELRSPGGGFASLLETAGRLRLLLGATVWAPQPLVGTEDLSKTCCYDARPGKCLGLLKAPCGSRGAKTAPPLWLCACASSCFACMRRVHCRCGQQPPQPSAVLAYQQGCQQL